MATSFGDYINNLLQNISPTGGMMSPEQQAAYEDAQAYAADPFRRQNAIRKAAEEAAAAEAAKRAVVDPSEYGRSGFESKLGTAPQSVYAGLSQPSWLASVATSIPGLGPLLGGLMSYSRTDSANTLAQTLKDAYGVDAYDKTNPLLGTVQGMFGYTNDNIAGMSNLYNKFSDEGNLFGYMNLAANPDIGNIYSQVYGTSNLNADQAGAVGQAIGQRIDSYIASGMSYNDAVNQASNDFEGGDSFERAWQNAQNEYRGSSNEGGWGGTAADNSNRSDPGAVGSMADSRDAPAGGGGWGYD